MIGPFQEADGAVSMRRILALFFSIASVPLGIIAIPAGAWYDFIPFMISVTATLLLLFFTTWADVTELAGKIKG